MVVCGADKSSSMPPFCQGPYFCGLFGDSVVVSLTSVSHVHESCCHVCVTCCMVMIDAKNRELIININIHTYIHHTYIMTANKHNTTHWTHFYYIVAIVIQPTTSLCLSVSPLVLRLTVPAQLTDCKETVTSPSRGE